MPPAHGCRTGYERARSGAGQGESTPAPGGDRLAKRHGAVNLDDRAARGEDPSAVLAFLATTLGLCDRNELVTAADLIERFDPASLPTEPLTLPESFLGEDAPDTVG